MEPRRLAIIIFIGVTCFTVLILLASAYNYKHHQAVRLEMPPGYSLEVNQKGQYRSIDNDGFPLFWWQGHETKQEAIDYAWKHYRNEDQEEAARVWRKVE